MHIGMEGNRRQIASLVLAIGMAVCLIFLIENLSLKHVQKVKLSERSYIVRPRGMRPSERRKLATKAALASTQGNSKARYQMLDGTPAAPADAAAENATDYITFENDYKLGGGDLMVPSTMVDYDNLGEGSIVDQRYPRVLPGYSQLVAELSDVFNLDGDWHWLE
mmetsp:Transcript_43183/g.115514  ORF Transcript_43183/g.115514 Transcript_43183/m.115514 type:complete len:165 (-) Transcript_43183:1013-1507(-)